jgi:hypothetical protein
VYTFLGHCTTHLGAWGLFHITDLLQEILISKANRSLLGYSVVFAEAGRFSIKLWKFLN